MNQKSVDILEVDKRILRDVATVFSGYVMNIFFDELSQRQVHIEIMDKFDNAIMTFLAADQKIRNSELAQSLTAFLLSLEELSAFTLRTFDSNDGVIARFYGRVSEYEILTECCQAYYKDEKEFLKLAKRVYSQWNKLHETVIELIPDFDWAASREKNKEVEKTVNNYINNGIAVNMGPDANVHGNQINNIHEEKITLSSADIDQIKHIADVIVTNEKQMLTQSVAFQAAAYLNQIAEAADNKDGEQQQQSVSVWKKWLGGLAPQVKIGLAVTSDIITVGTPIVKALLGMSPL